MNINNALKINKNALNVAGKNKFRCETELHQVVFFLPQPSSR